VHRHRLPNNNNNNNSSSSSSSSSSSIEDLPIAKLGQFWTLITGKHVFCISDISQIKYFPLKATVKIKITILFRMPGLANAF